MALVFMDGFDHYATADLGKKWSNVGTNPTIVTTTGRRNTRLMRMTTGTQAFIQYNHSASSYVIGMAVRRQSTGLTGTWALVKIMDGGSAQCTLRLADNNLFEVCRGTTTAITGGTATPTITQSEWNYIEWKVTIADSISAGSCVVRLNGNVIIDVPAGQDLQATANASGSGVRFGVEAANASSRDFDDIYICDGSGSTNNDFLGDCRIDLVMPSADGFYSDGTPSTGSDNFAMVNAIPVGTGNFVTLAGTGDRDSYQHGGVPITAGSIIYGVQVSAAVDKDDAGTRNAATFVRSGTVDDDGASVGLGTSYGILRDVYELNPDGNVAWNTTTVDDAEFGVVVTA
jgi:hypothetical protein